MRRYKLTLTLEYFFSGEDYETEAMLQDIIEEKVKKTLELLEKGKDRNYHIVKAHLDPLPF